MERCLGRDSLFAAHGQADTGKFEWVIRNFKQRPYPERSELVARVRWRRAGEIKVRARLLWDSLTDGSYTSESVLPAELVIESVAQVKQ